MNFGKAIDQFIRDMRVYGRINSEGSVTSYRQRLGVLAEVVGDRDPGEVTREHVKQALASWAHPNTQRTAHAIFVSFFDWCMEEDVRRDNPARQVRRAKKRRTSVYRLTKHEVVRLQDTSRASSRRETRLVYLGTCAGARNQELRGLQGRHFQRPGFVWFSSDIAKGGRERWVPVIVDLEPVVAEIVANVAADEYVIPGRRPIDPGSNRLWREYPDRPSSAQAIWRSVVEVAKRAGIHAHIHPHLLRHAFGDHVAKYAGLRAAQEMLGHVEVDTTASTYVDRPGLDELAVSVHGLSYRDFWSQAAARAPQLGDVTPLKPREAPTGIEPVSRSFHGGSLTGMEHIAPGCPDPGVGDVFPLRD